MIFIDFDQIFKTSVDFSNHIGFGFGTIQAIHEVWVPNMSISTKKVALFFKKSKVVEGVLELF